MQSMKLLQNTYPRRGSPLVLTVLCTTTDGLNLTVLEVSLVSRKDMSNFCFDGFSKPTDNSSYDFPHIVLRLMKMTDKISIVSVYQHIYIYLLRFILFMQTLGVVKWKNKLKCAMKASVSTLSTVLQCERNNKKNNSSITQIQVHNKTMCALFWYRKWTWNSLNCLVRITQT